SHENIKLCERSETLGEELLERLGKLENHPYVGHIRGKGLLVGIELVKNKDTKEPLEESLVNQVIGSCKSKGLIIGKNGDTVAGYNNILALSPPLNITDEDLDFIVNTIMESFSEQQ